MEQRKISQINQCIERIRAGDRRSAVEDLYDLMGNQIRFIALRYTHDSDDADDLVQDFWLNVCRYCDKYRVGSNGYFFLCKTFSRDCLDWLKRKEREPEPLTLEDIEYFESLGREDANESRLETMELHDKATAKMTERERLIYSLTIYEGLSIRDASRELNISKSSGARLFRKALEKVKVTLIEMGWDKNDL